MYAQKQVHWRVFITSLKNVRRTRRQDKRDPPMQHAAIDISPPNESLRRYDNEKEYPLFACRSVIN